MTITVEELRRKYPEPVEATITNVLDHADAYCVGGSLCLELGGKNGFPTVSAAVWWNERDSELTLDWALLIANPQLTAPQAAELAAHIMDENDEGNFDVAWAWLDKGLSA